MTKLIDFLHALHPLSPSLREYLYSNLESKEVKKRERLLRPGQVSGRIYFIEKGLFRGSYMEQTREVSTWFMKEGDLICSVISFFKQRPSQESIYAMEEGRIWSISYEQLNGIYRQYPEFNFTGRELIQKYYILSEERLCLLRMKSARDRYDGFLRLYPQLEDRMPAKYVASYLNITLEHLSRIKKDL